MRRTLIWSMIFLLVLSGSAFGMLFWLVSGKEGGDLGPLLLGTGCFFTLSLLCGIAMYSLKNQLDKLLAGLCALIPACVFLLYALLTTPYLIGHFKGPKLSARAVIRNYRATPIEWPGFDGPVGIRMELDLECPSPGRGVLYSPQVWMGAPNLSAPKEIFYSTMTRGYMHGVKTPAGENHLAFLKTVLDNKIDGRAEISGPHLPSHLVYNLYPGPLKNLLSTDKLCFDEYDYRIPPRGHEPPIYHDGDMINAIWLFFGEGGMIIDLSPQLMREMRSNGTMLDKPDAWIQMHKRLEPEGLLSAGYQHCNYSDSVPEQHSMYSCFCKDTTDPDKWKLDAQKSMSQPLARQPQDRGRERNLNPQ